MKSLVLVELGQMDDDIITLDMNCDLTWIGSFDGTNINNGYVVEMNDFCWNATRVSRTISYTNTIDYHGEIIDDLVEVSFTPVNDNRDCEFVEGPDADCNGECFGNAVVDCLGECGGDAVVDCLGECEGDTEG